MQCFFLIKRILMTIRPLQKQDNLALAKIIRHSIESLGLPSEGTAHGDPTTDHLFELFQTPNSFYWVAEENDIVLGGCGLYPSKGLPNGYCELVRFFITENVRGTGLGKVLMQKTIDTALELGYDSMYLESFPTMESAVHLYNKFGFESLKSPLGDTGHHACNVWMTKKL